MSGSRDMGEEAAALMRGGVGGSTDGGLDQWRCSGECGLRTE